MMRLLIAAITVGCLAGSSSLSFAAMTDTDIQQKLQGQGYTNVQIREHDKNHVDVTATRNGKVEKLAIDPQSGAVKPDTDNDD
jgi:hypothetical protein